MFRKPKTLKKLSPKINDMLVCIIALYILLVGIQLWLLFGTINKALDQEQLSFAGYSGLASCIIFMCVLYFLRYIPIVVTGQTSKDKAKDEPLKIVK